MSQGANLLVQVAFVSDASNEVNPRRRLIKGSGSFFNMIKKPFSGVVLLMEQIGVDRLEIQTLNLKTGQNWWRLTGTRALNLKIG